MKQEREVRTRCCRDEWTAARTEGCYERREQRNEEKHEPDRPDLCKRLHVDAVRIPDLRAVRPMLQVPDLVGTGARPCNWVADEVTPREVPHQRAAVASQREEARVQVGPARAAGTREGVPRSPGYRRGRAVMGERKRQTDNDANYERRPVRELRSPAEFEARRHHVSCERQHPGDYRENDKRHREPMTVVRSLSERRPALREAVETRCEDDGHNCRGRRDDQCRRELKAPRIQREREHDPASERDPGAPAVGEIKRRRKHDERGRRERARDRMRRARCEAEGEQQADHREDAE